MAYTLGEILANNGFDKQEAELWQHNADVAMDYLNSAYQMLVKEWDKCIGFPVKERAYGKFNEKRRKAISVVPEEPDITTELYHFINDERDKLKINDPARNLEPHCEEPVRSNKRKGKNSKKIDLCFRCGNHLLVFEAKRLVSNKDIKAYFGSEGIGCFTTEDSPYSDGPVGSMMGYAFAKDMKYWADSMCDKSLATISNDLVLSISCYTIGYSWEEKKGVGASILIIHQIMDFTKFVDHKRYSLLELKEQLAQ